jgi:hypothetical protein
MPKREMSIGVTVNLQNYESLRIEVEDDVETEEDVRSLVAFLDETLALFGRGDQATEKAVNHYRKRVLQGAIGGATGPAAVPTVEPVVAPPAPVPVATEPPEEGPAPKAAAKPAVPKAPAKIPAPSPTGAVCENCGAPVSAAEEKTSRLFVSKTLCKKCIQSL